MIRFKAITFKGKKTAMKAYHSLEDFSPEYDWIDDLAVVSRSKHGHLRINTLWAHGKETVKGLGFGTLTGKLIGKLAGPAAVEKIDGLLGTEEDAAFDYQRLDDFAAALNRDTSALILMGEEETVADFGLAVEPFGGEVIDTDLDEKDIKALRKALK